VSAPARVPTAVAVALDAVAVLVFATVGRRSHAEGVAVVGVLRTAWPFLAGAAAGWLVTRSRSVPPGSLAGGLPVWLGALLWGMLLRVVTGAGTAASFVVVAAVALAVLLLGWRLVWWLMARVLPARQHPAEAAGRRP
jgi:hypothetical protein